jgi:phosphatidylserine/phosphatidylglycerophosphate/cardiolipin synthase-like enzyme
MNTQTKTFPALLILILLAVLLLFLLHRRSAPRMDLPGTDVASPYCAFDAEASRLLIDSTTFDPERRERVIEQEIFDEILRMIDTAESFIVADFFLLNPWKGSVAMDHRALSSELASRLVARKQSNPELRILLLTDPINRIYGADEPEYYHEMLAAGIEIVFTDVDRLPPSNLLYSPSAALLLPLAERLPFFQRRLVDNPFDSGGRKISPLQLLRLLHFRANHRKLIVVDDAAGELHLLVTSFNPADGSAAHSNIAVRTRGAVARHALAAELDCVEWSAARPRNRLIPEGRNLSATLDYCRAFTAPDASSEPSSDAPRAQWLTEQAIRRKLLAMLDAASAGERVDIAIFYFSDRAVVRAVAAAARRGARVRIIMDANKDAFGREKNGIPNRTVAAELLRSGSENGGVEIRWALTHGEQFHSKAVAIYDESGAKSQFLCGSANWTRRNIQNLNLEACICIENAPGFVREYSEYFDRIWNNASGTLATTDYEQYAESGWSLWWKNILYRIQERSGLSTF